MEEGAKAVYTETEVDALITAEETARDAAIAVEAAARAAAIVTHAALYNLHTKVIRKAADQTVNNSETLVNDAELKFAVAANEVWAFIQILITSSSAAADLNCQFSVPSGASLYGFAWGYDADVSFTGGPIAGGVGFTIGGLGTDIILMIISGTIINGSTAGNLQFQWAQATAEESDTIVRKNSCILAWKLA